LQEALRRPLFDDLAGDLLDECLPVRRWDVRLVGDFLAVDTLAEVEGLKRDEAILLSVYCFEHQQRFP